MCCVAVNTEQRPPSQFPPSQFQEYGCNSTPTVCYTKIQQATILATALAGTGVASTPPNRSGTINDQTAKGAADGLPACHSWKSRQDNNACVIPLPEECSERREIEIEIDLWETGGGNKERGDHLGQVRSVTGQHGTTNKGHFLYLKCPVVFVLF